MSQHNPDNQLNNPEQEADPYLLMQKQLAELRIMNSKLEDVLQNQRVEDGTPETINYVRQFAVFVCGVIFLLALYMNLLLLKEYAMVLFWAVVCAAVLFEVKLDLIYVVCLVVAPATVASKDAEDTLEDEARAMLPWALRQEGGGKLPEDTLDVAMVRMASNNLKFWFAFFGKCLLNLCIPGTTSSSQIYFGMLWRSIVLLLYFHYLLPLYPSFPDDFLLWGSLVWFGLPLLSIGKGSFDLLLYDPHLKQRQRRSRSSGDKEGSTPEPGTGDKSEGKGRPLLSPPMKEDSISEKSKGSRKSKASRKTRSKSREKPKKTSLERIIISLSLIYTRVYDNVAYFILKFKLRLNIFLLENINTIAAVFLMVFGIIFVGGLVAFFGLKVAEEALLVWQKFAPALDSIPLFLGKLPPLSGYAGQAANLTQNYLAEFIATDSVSTKTRVLYGYVDFLFNNITVAEQAMLLSQMGTFHPVGSPGSDAEINEMDNSKWDKLRKYAKVATSLFWRNHGLNVTSVDAPPVRNLSIDFLFETFVNMTRCEASSSSASTLIEGDIETGDIYVPDEWLKEARKSTCPMSLENEGKSCVPPSEDSRQEKTKEVKSPLSRGLDALLGSQLSKSLRFHFRESCVNLTEHGINPHGLKGTTEVLLLFKAGQLKELLSLPRYEAVLEELSEFYGDFEEYNSYVVTGGASLLGQALRVGGLWSISSIGLSVNVVYSVLFGLFDSMIQAVFFLTALYYLLNSRVSTFHYSAVVLDIVDPSEHLTFTLQKSFRAILFSAIKLASFHGGFTWVVYTYSNAPLVYIPSLLAFVMGMVPVVSPILITMVIPLVEVLENGVTIDFSLSLLINFCVYWFTAPAIYAEIPDANPWATALSVALGIGMFGARGVILGPVLGVIPFAAYGLMFSFVKRRKTDEDALDFLPKLEQPGRSGTERNNFRFSSDFGRYFASPSRMRSFESEDENSVGRCESLDDFNAGDIPPHFEGSPLHRYSMSSSPPPGGYAQRSPNNKVGVRSIWDIVDKARERTHSFVVEPKSLRKMIARAEGAVVSSSSSGEVGGGVEKKKKERTPVDPRRLFKAVTGLDRA